MLFLFQMKKSECPFCFLPTSMSVRRKSVVSKGRFYRKSDRKWVGKFFCKRCRSYFTKSHDHMAFGQNKRQLNQTLKTLLCSGVSQRRAAKILKISRTTVARKLIFLARKVKPLKTNKKVTVLEFDDLETFEHTKCKPLSVTLAVEHRTRRILGFEVSQMPAKGKLARISRRKYGLRRDERAKGRRRLFEQIKSQVCEQALIKSDENPHYPQAVKTHFPKATHERHKGQRGSIVGQGELKRVRFDPLFSLNHTCAMLRANINRLFRKTWCTTKKPERLRDHILIYMDYHNNSLLKPP